MKYLKLLAMALLPLSMVACSDDDENINTGNATVEFESATMEVRESTSMLRIPINVSGEHTGDIHVSAKMTGNNANFEADKDVIVTTEKFTLPAETETVYLEAHLNVGNDAIEAGRTITFEITEAAGATLGSNKTCTVVLKENNPLEGVYTLKGFSPFDGAVSSEKCELFMEEGVNDKAYLNFGFDGAVELQLTEVVPGKEYNITIKGAQSVGTDPTYGNVTFPLCMVDWNAGEIKPFADDITATYKDGIITLKTEEDYGVGLLCSAGWFSCYVAYIDDASGDLVPVTLTK